MKILGKIIGFILLLVILFFALHSLICFFIPWLVSGANFFELVKIIALDIWNGIKILIGV